MVGRFDESRQNGRVCQIQLLRRFAEIEIRRGGDAETVVPEIDAVQIFFQNFLFGVPFLQSVRQFPFLQLSFDRLFPREVGIFHELLGNGRRTFFEGPRFQIIERGFGDTSDVKSVVLVKALVFDADEGKLRMLGDIFELGRLLDGKSGHVVDRLPVAIVYEQMVVRERQLFGDEGDVLRGGEIVSHEQGEENDGGNE